MLKITLPVQPVDLSQMLFQHNSHIIDMELAERYGCSIVVGSFREVNDERDRLGLSRVTEARPSEVSTADYAKDYQDVTLSLHHRKAAFISSFIHPYKEKYFTGRVQFELFVNGIEAEEKFLVIRRTGLKPLAKPDTYSNNNEIHVSDSCQPGNTRPKLALKLRIERFVKKYGDLIKWTGKTLLALLGVLMILWFVGTYKEQPTSTEHQNKILSSAFAEGNQDGNEPTMISNQLESITNPTKNNDSSDIQ
ncbi:hypothetical protein [Vibrio owensii]|uniref:Uncharacterized protein n=1 Tax=Vibrio owensii CAIM 1854 = LMG 25443 TaxID=1229493 RepID=A0A0C1VSX3_9VIBR|nr:hypothetical protein [Vibrio owensii]KIF53018.1 hypothetical protein H735_08695 [Vibrio owensii CAIM 1854 = LMG 25443]